MLQAVAHSAQRSRHQLLAWTLVEVAQLAQLAQAPQEHRQVPAEPSVRHRLARRRRVPRAQPVHRPLGCRQALQEQPVFQQLDQAIL